jgi:hypothetical protein
MRCVQAYALWTALYALCTGPVCVVYGPCMRCVRETTLPALACYMQELLNVCALMS